MMLPLVYADCSTYIAQQDISLERVAYDLGLDVSDIRASNPMADNPLAVGDRLCIDKDYKSAGFSYSPWQAWQVLGTVRGFDFLEFMLYNSVKNSPLPLTEDDLRPGFDPYSASRFNRYHLDKVFDPAYEDKLDDRNRQLLDSIISLDPSERTHQLGTSITLPSDGFLGSIDGLDIHIVAIDRKMVDSSSLSMGAIAGKISSRIFGPGSVDPILIIVIPDEVISISYDIRSVISDTGYFDDLIGDVETTSSMDLTELVGRIQVRKTQLSTLSGDTVATHAKRYVDDYKEMPYVYGGESPYSYEETSADEFFEGVSITERQPYTNEPTVPGFDAAGFVWWTLENSGLELSRMDIRGLHQYARDNWEVSDGSQGDIVFQDSYVGMIVDGRVAASTVRNDGLGYLDIEDDAEAYDPYG